MCITQIWSYSPVNMTEVMFCVATRSSPPSAALALLVRTITKHCSDHSTEAPNITVQDLTMNQDVLSLVEVVLFGRDEEVYTTSDSDDSNIVIVVASSGGFLLLILLTALVTTGVFTAVYLSRRRRKS